MTTNGRLWEVNNEGFLRNDANKDKVKEEFQSTIDSVIAACQTVMRKQMLTIYLTDDVARGVAEPGKAHIVFLALMKPVVKDLNVYWLNNAMERIRRLEDSVSTVRMEILPNDSVFTGDIRFSPGSFQINTRSVHVHGKRPWLPRYKIAAPVANDPIFHIRGRLQDAAEKLQAEDNLVDDIKMQSRLIADEIIQTGFALVMLEENVYTRDHELCIEYFGKHYADKVADMQKALAWVNEPPEDPAELLAFMDEFGGWLTGEAERWLDEHNPEYIEFMPIPDDWVPPRWLGKDDDDNDSDNGDENSEAKEPDEG